MPASALDAKLSC